MNNTFAASVYCNFDAVATYAIKPERNPLNWINS
jgi:hypothetical protein